MNEQTLIQNAALLLQHSTEIIKNYDELYRKTGKKYNIFQIARIDEKEVIMCRIIADLLNPQGKHYKGDVYLKLFWDMVSAKIKNCPKLNTSNAVVTTEYSIEANRRIDIVVEDGSIFVPIEVKIRAGEQENQIKDYAAYSQKKNGDKYVPVLYLTPEGKPSETADSNEYIRLTFNKDILIWLERCLKANETENTPPVCEVLKQLITAIRSIIGYSEDEKMNKAILDLIIQSDETVHAAAEIEHALTTIDEEKWEIFKNDIFEKVQKQFSGTEICDRDDWNAIGVPIKNGAYTLYVNYDWQSITVEANNKEMPVSVKKNINKTMIALTGVSDDAIDGNWLKENTIRYPGMGTIDDNTYSYLLYRKYVKNPDEAANHIITMAKELEKI
jgi:hypothetical protein